MNKRVLVTGASKGIGKQIAIDLAAASYHVVIHYHSDETGALECKKIIEEAHGSASLIQFDISKREEAKEKIERDNDAFGAYYGVICNAGITRDSVFPAMTDDDWDSVLRTNLDGFYNVVKPCLMPMITKREPARIVALSSVSGLMGNRGQVNYSAAKAGLIGAIKALAVELAKRNITVNCVAPGLIDTGMITPDIFEHAKPLIPMQRMGRVEEVSGLVKFLLSKEASYITRQVISVNGGMF